MKKAQTLSLNVIIVAALGLIVLVVLIAVFTGRIGTFGGEVSKVEQGRSCDDLQGSWVDGFSCPDGQRSVTVLDRDDLAMHQGQVCCISS